jgi:RNA polymerase sigma-70 factor (ECF subfamily)
MDHHAAVFRYAFRLAGNQQDAEDLTQQTFLTAQQHLQQLRDPGRVVAWLLAVVRNAFLKTRRRIQPATAASLDLEMDEVPAPPAAADEIDREMLELALEELPDEFRIVLLMFYFEDYSYKEIATELEIPMGTVMSRLARAKGHMRRRLSKPDEKRLAQPNSVGEPQRPSAVEEERRQTDQMSGRGV